MRQTDSKTRLFNRSGALVIATALMLFALAVHADPIQDGSLAPYRAGWFDNGGTMSCTATCKAKAPGTLPEYEPSPIEPTKRTFVCKVAGKPKGDIQTWLYGNQFDERPACYTTGVDLKGSHSPKYFCLCVAK